VACKLCGADGPTQAVHFQQNIGIYFARRSRAVKAELCRPCIGLVFRSYTLTTLFLGWWGLISFFMTPVMLISNISQYLRVRGLPEPGVQIANVPLGYRPRLVSQKVFMAKLLYGVFVWGAVLALLFHLWAESR
jgi:hypothetical protein